LCRSPLFSPREKGDIPLKFSHRSHHNGAVVFRIAGIFVVAAMSSLIRILLTFTCGFTPPAWNASQTAHDERLLGLNASPGPVIIERFRNNMLTAAEEKDVRRLVEQLGADDYRQREKAHYELNFWRAGADAVLRQYEHDASLERRRRVRQILGKGMGRWSNLQAEAAARLLRKSPSIEAVRVLVDYCPYADDAGVQKEIAAALRDFAGQSPDFAAAIRRAAADPRWREMGGLLSQDKAKEISPTLQALDQARAFFSLVAQGEIAKLADSTRLPFALGNGVVVTSPNQRDDFFKQATANYRDANRNATLMFLHVVRGEEHLRFADDQEREFLSGIPADELRAVHVRVRRDWQNEEVGVILVQASPGGAQVIGLGRTGIRGVRGK
jgi:hypothetical protein